MRRLLGVLSVVALATVAIGLMPLVVAGAAGTTRWVNDDKPLAAAPGQNCNKPGYATIQDAINASAPGDSVRVCAGTYAGAAVDREVHIRGDNGAVIDTGPFTHAGLFRAAFIFNLDKTAAADGPIPAGHGATIEGFTIVGATQFAGSDDGSLDFGVFSRGANDVTVTRNSFSDLLQAVTDWNGMGWEISFNTIADPWTRCGGGIGILVGGFDGTTAVTGNEVAHNIVRGTLQVSPGDCGGYSGTGITLFSDHRFGRPGALTVDDNTVEKNAVEMISDTPGTVDVNGIELTVAASTAPVMTDNLIAKNRVSGAPAYGILVNEGAVSNDFDKNDVDGASVYSCEDDSVGTGTAGTANSWTKNRADSPSLPAGICD